MKPPRPGSWSFLTLAVLLLGVAASCAPSYVSVLRLPPGGYKPISGTTPTLDVVPIALLYDQTKDKFYSAVPIQSVTGDVDVAIWVVFAPGNAKVTAITWPATNPFPATTCPGNRFCFSMSPSSAANGIYNYSATIQYNGKTYSLDPSVEIWRP